MKLRTGGWKNSDEWMIYHELWDGVITLYFVNAVVAASACSMAFKSQIDDDLGTLNKNHKLYATMTFANFRKGIFEKK